MGAISYLFLHKIKNGLKQFVKSPGKLVFTIIIVLFFGLGLVSAFLVEAPEQPSLDRSYLVGGILLVYALLFYLSLNKGFSSGATIFRMPDINLLFVSPYHPRRLMIYALIQQLGTSIFAGIFLIFQYSWMKNSFGISFMDMIVILLVYVLLLFMTQLLTMIVYNLTHSNERLKWIFRAILYLPIPVLAVYVILPPLLNGNGIGLPLLSDIGTNAASLFLPICGWVMIIVKGVLLSNTQLILIGAVVLTLVFIGLILALFLIEMDYYEDVLQTTEASYMAVTAAKEGRIQEAAPKNVKKGKLGIGRGHGANTFYYKHLIENRRGKTLMLSPVMMILIACGIVASVFLKNLGMAPLFAFMIYMKIFTIGMDRLPRELLKPFIYLVPESSFLKLIYCMKEAIPGYFLEAILLYVPAGLIMEVPIPEIIIYVLASISFSFLFICGNLFVERILGQITIKILLILLYVFILILFSLPGIITGFVLLGNDIVLISETFTVLSCCLVCNLFLALLLIFFSRNILNHAECNY